MTQPAPTKLFREEAKTGAIDCPGCGAPITLHAFGGVEQIACSYCGTICKPEDDGNLEILQKAERARRQSVLPLHIRGEFEGQTWEIVGIVWREVVADGSCYPWQEFLLFNPYAGYRWLIFQMSDGVWSIGGPLDGAVAVEAGMQPVATWQGERYRHFTSGNARTTYVEGEFPWQVLVGDVAQANDYVCPPKLISIEIQKTEGGSDINFTMMRPIDGAEVWAAFKRPGAPPPCYGIHPAAPNPYADKFFRRAALALFGAWLLLTVIYVGGREGKVVYTIGLDDTDTVTAEVDLGDDDRRSLEFELQAVGMNNSWAYADVMLVDPVTEEAIALGLEVDAYSGVDGGESWSEGTNPRTVVVGNVPGGKYVLQAAAQFDTAGDRADRLQLTIKRDVSLLRYVFLPLLIISVFPLFNLFRRLSFEAKRWSTSDHVASSDDD